MAMEPKRRLPKAGQRRSVLPGARRSGAAAYPEAVAEARPARVVGWSSRGEPLVALSEEGGTTVAARVSYRVSDAALHAAVARGWDVVVVSLGGDAARPAIVDILRPPEVADADALPATPGLRDPQALTVRDEGGKVVLEASAPGTKALCLRCGDASITVESDGTVTVQGRDVVTRAKQTFRVRSGTVCLN